jgi:hypothetical protein
MGFTLTDKYTYNSERDVVRIGFPTPLSFIQLILLFLTFRRNMARRKKIPTLPEAVEMVSTRMQEDGPGGRGCEMQVRYSLIDPILRALGWDLDAPNSVQVELNVKDTVTNKRRDYTFCIKGKKIAILESKRWGAMSKALELRKKDRDDKIPGLNQLQSYCKTSNIKVGIISDGGCWVRFRFRPNFKLYKNGTSLIDYNCEKVGVNEKENRKNILKFFRSLSPRNLST